MNQRPNSHDGSLASYAFPEHLSPNNNYSASGRLLLSSMAMPGDPPRTASPVYKYRGGGQPVIWKTFEPQEHVRSPPVGTYNITRVLDDNQPSKNDVYGHSMTSSFKSSGRSKPLMRDAVHYATMGNDWKSTHLGPGYYRLRDTWSSEDRRSSDRIVTRELKASGSSKRIVVLPAMEDKPWRIKPLDIKQAKQKSTEAPGSCVGIGIVEDLRERQEEILSVRNLPVYR